jgi:HAD superfamily hydrolase (TIGR01549 family)
MKKLLIFDFDGVIANSEEPRLKVFKQILNNNRINISKDILFNLIGIPGKNFIEENLKEIDQKLKNKILEEYKDNYLNKIDSFIKPVDITVNFIKNYKGNLKLAIATMSTQNLVDDILRQFKIKDFFEILVTRKDVLKHKPDPEIYIKTAKKIVINPSECVVVEDTKIGAKAAIAAKMDCYILINKFNKKSDFNDLKISGFINTESDFYKILSLN